MSKVYFPEFNHELETVHNCRILRSPEVKELYPHLRFSYQDPESCECSLIVDLLEHFVQSQVSDYQSVPRGWFFSKSALKRAQDHWDSDEGDMFLEDGERKTWRVLEHVEIVPVLRKGIRNTLKFLVVVGCTAALVVLLRLTPHADSLSELGWCIMSLLFVVYIGGRLWDTAGWFNPSVGHTLIHSYTITKHHMRYVSAADLRNRSSNFASSPVQPRLVDFEYDCELREGFLHQSESPNPVSVAHLDGHYRSMVNKFNRFLYEPVLGVEGVAMSTWRPFTPVLPGRASEQLIVQVWNATAGMATRSHDVFRKHLESRVSNNTHVNLPAAMSFYDNLHWNSLVLCASYAYSRRQRSGLPDYSFGEEAP